MPNPFYKPHSARNYKNLSELQISPTNILFSVSHFDNIPVDNIPKPM